jgi:membrane-associated phospholipid phosphatase
MKNTQSIINTFKKHPFFIAIFIATVLIWLASLNNPLFLFINQGFKLLPLSFWNTINNLSNPSYGILSLILLISCCFRREKLLNIVMLIIAYYIIFQFLKTIIHSPRPYIVYNAGEFFWIPLSSSDFSQAAGMRSFPSGHTGQAAIFVFASIHLWAENKRLWLRTLFIAFLGIVMLTRLCTGWHFPLDVLTGALLGFVLTEIFWYLPFSPHVCFWREKNCHHPN